MGIEQKQKLNRDTLKPLMDIINESERANEVMNQQKTILQDGK